MRRAYRRAPGFVIPVLRIVQQGPDSSMYEANARGELPAVVFPVQTAGKENVHHVAVVLLQASGSRRHALGDAERLGDQRREALHEHPRDERDEHQVHVCVEGANPRTEGVIVEPGGRFVERLDEIAQDLRRLAQSLIPLLYSGRDEAVQIGGRHGREFLHDRIERGVPDGGVPDLVVGGFRVDGARLGVAVDICGRYVFHMGRSIRSLSAVGLPRSSVGSSRAFPLRPAKITIRYAKCRTRIYRSSLR